VREGIAVRKVRTVEAYVPLFDAAVLASEADGFPVAALQVRPRHVAGAGAAAEAGAAGAAGAPPAGGGSLAVLRGLPDGSLQCMASADEMEIELIITNLLPRQSLKFEVASTAPGSGGAPSGALLNAARAVLAPGESFVIDRHAGRDVALRLREVKEAAASGALAPVALATELARSAADKRGS
jgi:hypothetical protein